MTSTDQAPAGVRFPIPHIDPATMRTRITLVYPYDPLGKKVGGVETFVRGFIAHAPAHAEVSMVGITTSPKNYPVGRWHQIVVSGREISFYPLLSLADENVKLRIPLSLRFTLKLMLSSLDFSTDVVLYNRIEPSLAIPPNSTRGTIGFIHNDIEKQISPDSEYAWRHVAKLYFMLEAYLLRRFSKIFCVNMNTVNFYAAKYPALADRVSFLPTWVDDAVFQPKSPDVSGSEKDKIAERYGLPPTPPWILFVGRLQKQKNPLLLVDTLKEVLAVSPSAILIVIGEGNMRQEMLDHAAKAGVSNHLYILNSQPQETVAQFYRQSNVFLLTSNFEGMPRACVEALGCGLPVVTTNVGEVGRLIKDGNGGVIVNSWDPRELASAIADVLVGAPRFASEICIDATREFQPQLILKDLYSLCDALGAASTVHSNPKGK
jgi:glycosyltransferase involved in cell wall biosynthesis